MVKFFFADFLQEDYFFILLLILLVIYTCCNRHFGPREKHRMVVLALITLLLVVISYIDSRLDGLVPGTAEEAMKLYTPDHPFPFYRLRAAVITGGYVLRPWALLYGLILIFGTPDRNAVKFAVPAAVSSLLSVAGAFGHFMVWVDYTGLWSNDKLVWFYFLTCAFYFIAFGLEYFHRRRRYTLLTNVSVVISLLAVLCGMALDMTADYAVNALSDAIVLAVVAFYLGQETGWANTVIDLQAERIRAQKEAILNEQIQPHFIYNMLNVIRELCAEDPELAARTIDTFSQYLRDNTRLGAEAGTIPAEKELQHCRAYSDLEQIRFPNLTMHYVVRDGGYQLPFLTIQPLVENAIRHGVRNRENGTVTVTLMPGEDKNGRPVHRIEVRDNGNGKSLADPVPGGRKGIGLPNVKSRIETLCGGTFTIDFTPTGTSAVIEIPDNAQCKMDNTAR